MSTVFAKSMNRPSFCKINYNPQLSTKLIRIYTTVYKLV